MDYCVRLGSVCWCRGNCGSFPVNYSTMGENPWKRAGVGDNQPGPSDGHSSLVGRERDVRQLVRGETSNHASGKS